MPKQNPQGLNPVMSSKGYAQNQTGTPQHTTLDRRTFLRYSALVGVGYAAAECRAATVAEVRTNRPVALVLDDPDLPEGNRLYAKSLMDILATAGYQPAAITLMHMLTPETLSPARCALLVLPMAQSIPGMTQQTVRQYLHTGGHLLALGAPAWNQHLVKSPSGKWKVPADSATEWALIPVGHSVFNLAPVNQNMWQRSTNTPNSPTHVTVVPVQDAERHAMALHVEISNLTGWDTQVAPVPQQTFSHGRTMTVFSAKGGPNTPSLSIEWDDMDGSRWVAVVALSEHWQRYSLPPTAFKRYTHGNILSGPAGEGFVPAKASSFHVGLAFNFTGPIGGRQEYWISQISTATAHEAPALPPTTADISPLTALCPGYKFYPIHGPVRLLIGAALPEASSAERIVPPRQLIASYPRPGGTGFAKDRPYRWSALLEAVDAHNGTWRGAPATLVMHSPTSEYRGGMWAVFTPTERNFYQQPAVRKVLVMAAQRIRRGWFLTEGGAEFYTYFPDQPVRLGAAIAHVATGRKGADNVKVSLVVRDAKQQIVLQRTWPVSPQHDSTTRLEFTWKPPTVWPEGGYTVTTELVKSGILLDRLAHWIHVWTPSAKPNWIRIKPDGHFYLNDKIWRINGVNYMPSSGPGREDFILFDHYLSRRSYDPVIIERDLKRIANIGFNAVSIFLHLVDLDSQNLLDLLRLCRVHNLRVNLGLRPGLSDDLISEDRHAAEQTAWNTYKTIIEHYRLAFNDTVFAYDIDWEPSFARFGERRRTAGAWSKWVEKKYGSIAHAEKQWNFHAPRNAQGLLTEPSAAELMAQQGALCTKMVLAFRQFLNDWLADTYALPVQRIREITPHQFVSFRMSTASDPNGGPERYQFAGLARAVNFLAPETYYELQPNGTNADELVFRIAYGRAVAPRLPIIWAETGFSIWNLPQMDDSPALARDQGQYAAKFYQLLRFTGADGVFWWYYPGGYRTDEHSDYGVINPDGTDRPSTTAIRAYGPEFLSAPAITEPSLYLEYDPALYPDGVTGIFQHLRPQLDQAIARGHMPALRSVHGYATVHKP